MKTVKWIGIYLLALMVTAGFVSCGEDDYQSRLRELIIKDLSFDANEDMEGELSHTMTFRNESLKNYAAVADAAWCHVDINADLSQITVRVDENTSNEERKSTVTLFDVVDTSVSRTFTVTQKQNNVVRVSGNTTYEMPTDGGSANFIVEYNVNDYVVSKVYDEDWMHITVGRTRSLQAAQILVEVDKNDTGEPRSGYFTIESEEANAYIVCRIDQQFVGYFNLLNTALSIDENGGTVSINAQTNLKEFDVYLTREDTWVRNLGREFLPDLGVVTQRISIDPYEEKGTGRSTTITIHDEEVTITQYRNIYIKESAITVAGFESKALTLYNAKDESVKWSSSDESIATVDDKGVVTGHKIGTATITVTSTDGKHKDTATVEVGSTFSIPETEYTIDELGGTVNITTKTNLTQFEVNLSDNWVTNAKIAADAAKGEAVVTVTVAPYTVKSTGRVTVVKVNGIDVKIYQARTLYIEESDVTLAGTDSKTLTLYNPNRDTVKWSTSDKAVATVDANGKVTGVKEGKAVITVTSSDGKHTDTVNVTVEKPAALTKEDLPYDWQINYETFGDTATVISAIGCTLTNKSNYTIMLSKCDFYRDDKQVSSVSYNTVSGKLPSGESKKATFDNLVMWKDVTIEIEVPDPDENPDPEVDPDDGKDDGKDADTGKDTDDGKDADTGKDTDDGKDADTGKDTDTDKDADLGTDTDTGKDADADKDSDADKNSGSDADKGSDSNNDSSTSSSSARSRNRARAYNRSRTRTARTRAIETKVIRVLDTDDHTYSVVWTYTYNGEPFTYKCEEIKTNARVRSRARTSSARRSRRGR